MPAETILKAIVASVAVRYGLDPVRLDRARAAFRFGAGRIEQARCPALELYRMQAEEAAKILAAYNKSEGP